MSVDLESVIAFLLALWALASAFVAMTPSAKDDEALSKLRAFLERLSFLQPKTSKGVLSMPGKPAGPVKVADESEVL